MIDIRTRLRSATKTDHEALETELALLRPPLSQARFTRLLERFFGFHAVWEPALRQHPALHAITRGRGRLALLRADLAALGVAPAAVERLPRCVAAGALSASLEGAIGSLYVMEGSTLGGQLISRTLAQAPWLPPGGLSYFSPYGADTGARWREFTAWLEVAAATCPAGTVEAGATETFRQLREWMGEAQTAAL